MSNCALQESRKNSRLPELQATTGRMVRVRSDRIQSATAREAAVHYGGYCRTRRQLLVSGICGKLLGQRLSYYSDHLALIHFVGNAHDGLRFFDEAVGRVIHGAAVAELDALHNAEYIKAARSLRHLIL